MKHIQILFLVVNLIIGTSVIIYINNLRRRFIDDTLKHLLLYLLSFNLLIFVDFNYKYTLYNIYGNNFNTYSAILAVILYFLVSVAEFGMVFYLYHTSVSLKNRNVSKYFVYTFGLLFAVYFVGSIIGITAYYLKSIEKWLYLIHMVWIFAIYSLILSILIDLFLYSLRLKEHRTRLNLLSFAIIMLVGYTFFAISNLDFYIFKLNISNLDPFIFAILNLSPFLWLKFIYSKHLGESEHYSTNTDSFQNVINDHNISGREVEVIKLIVEGKSSKEIEDILNISLNTVKNHIYNLYKKLNVNSRSQLIRFINNYKKNS
jgi:DNA-binding CsgD family transcriptional regulator